MGDGLNCAACATVTISTIGFLVGAEIEMARLEGANLELSEQLGTRKAIERAKGILQRELQLIEEEAYLTLQKQGRQRTLNFARGLRSRLTPIVLLGKHHPPNNVTSELPGQ